MAARKQENLLKKRLLDRISQVSEEDLDQEVDFTEELDIEGLTPVNNNEAAVPSPTANETVGQLQAEIANLKNQLMAANEKVVDTEALQQENFKLSQLTKQLNMKLENNQAAWEELVEKNNQLEDENHRLKQLEDTNQTGQDIAELLEKNRSLNDLVAIKEQRITELEELTRMNETNIQEIIERAEKAAELQKQAIDLQEILLEREAAIKQLESELQEVKNSEDFSSENQEVLEKLKMNEIEKQELLEQLADLKEQVRNLTSENDTLKNRPAVGGATSEHERVEELRKELQDILQEKTDLEIQMGRMQGLNDKYLVQKDVLEAEVKGLRNSYQSKEAELERVKSEIETMRSATEGSATNDGQLVELLQAKQQVNDLLFKNQALQEEAIKSQQEIGEVMVSAKKEATRIISEAQVEAKHIINSAELEMLNIGNRAKTISNEVEESKNEILGIYRELEDRLNKLSRLDKLDR